MSTERLVERLTADIVTTIRTENLRAGQALPPARRLAEDLHVTVPTIREALRRLESVGIVELRHGSGTYVGDAFERRILDNPYYLPTEVDGTIELLDARIAIEPGIAALAASNRTEEQLGSLDAAADVALEIEPAVRPGHFHSALAASTGNRALGETLDSLLTIHARAQRSARVKYDRVKDHAEHLGMVDAIRRGDAGAAATRTEAHLRNIKAAIIDSWEKTS